MTSYDNTNSSRHIERDGRQSGRWLCSSWSLTLVPSFCCRRRSIRRPAPSSRFSGASVCRFSVSAATFPAVQRQRLQIHLRCRVPVLSAPAHHDVSGCLDSAPADPPSTAPCFCSSGIDVYRFFNFDAVFLVVRCQRLPFLYRRHGAPLP